LYEAKYQQYTLRLPAGHTHHRIEASECELETV